LSFPANPKPTQLTIKSIPPTTNALEKWEGTVKKGEQAKEQVSFCGK
jgi:hypothetical protein